MTRNLIYFVYPRASNGVWQWNVDQLLGRIDQFDGERIAIACVDESTDSAISVWEMFMRTNIPVRVLKVQNSSRAAADTFNCEIARYATLPGITFYAHAKGVTRDKHPTVRPWTAAMYAALLDQPHLIDEALADHACVGAFRRFGVFPSTHGHHWSYPGTFFWVRNDFMAYRQPALPYFWGVEAWTGQAFHPDVSATLVLDRCNSLYSEPYFATHAQPAIDNFHAAHQNPASLQQEHKHGIP